MGRCVSDKTLSRYLDGDLPAPLADEVRAHLAGCPACAGALGRMREVDAAVRSASPPAADAPDVAGRVSGELHRRGAFLAARVAAGRRRMFGESLVSRRMAAALGVAAALLVTGLAGADWLTRDAWARRTVPVVADAERILVRLVCTESPSGASRLAWARDEARKLDLPARLAEAQSGADPALAGDLASLEAAFAALADEAPLSADLAAQLAAGQVLEHAAHVREALAGRG